MIGWKKCMDYEVDCVRPKLEPGYRERLSEIYKYVRKMLWTIGNGES